MRIPCWLPTFGFGMFVACSVAAVALADEPVKMDPNTYPPIPLINGITPKMDDGSNAALPSPATIIQNPPLRLMFPSPVTAAGITLILKADGTCEGDAPGFVAKVAELTGADVANTILAWLVVRAVKDGGCAP